MILISFGLIIILMCFFYLSALEITLIFHFLEQMLIVWTNWEKNTTQVLHQYSREKNKTFWLKDIFIEIKSSSTFLFDYRFLLNSFPLTIFNQGKQMTNIKQPIKCWKMFKTNWTRPKLTKVRVQGPRRSRNSLTTWRGCTLVFTGAWWICVNQFTKGNINHCPLNHLFDFLFYSNFNYFNSSFELPE